MRITRFRIPRRVSLPGLVVNVLELPDDEMCSEDDMCDGYFDYDLESGTCQIGIRKSLPLRQKRYVLIHELQHALVDLLDVGINRFPHILSFPPRTSTRPPASKG